MNSIGSLLKNVRINANFTQKEIAKELFVTQSYISQVENGAKLPTKKFLKLFSLLFSLDKSELIDMRKNNDMDNS